MKYYQFVADELLINFKMFNKHLTFNTGQHVISQIGFDYFESFALLSTSAAACIYTLVSQGLIFAS